MNYIELLKRAFYITWRYRPLWLFGFLLALCSGGGSHFNFSGSGGSGDFEDLEGLPGLPEIDQNTLIALVVGLVCLILLLTAVGVIIQFVSRTALIRMVHQITNTGAITVAEGWRLGWSIQSWRLFLVNLLIGIPLAIFTIALVLLALSPLLLLVTEDMIFIILGIILAVLAVIFVILMLLLIGAVIGPIQELAGRRTVLDQQGVFDSLRDAFGLIKKRFKDVAIMWLIMLGASLGWGIVAFIIVLPASLLAAALVGGIPAGLVYLISRSWMSTAIAGIPLGLLAFILVSSFATGFFLIYQSAVWTLTYLELTKIEPPDDKPGNDQSALASPTSLAPADSS